MSAAPFFTTGGTLAPSAPSYLERPADAELFSALASGEIAYVLDSRQKGKSSLMARCLVRLREWGIATVRIDLQRYGTSLDPERWYAELAFTIGQELGLEGEVLEYWQANLARSPVRRWIAVLEDVVLAMEPRQVVVFIDEIDFVRSLSFSTDEFFAAIRELYNRRSHQPDLVRITFCMLGVATPSELIQDVRITPFNVGRRIELSDFAAEDLQPYAEHLGMDLDAGLRAVSRAHHWTGGHPFLTQVACAELARTQGREGVDELIHRLFLSEEGRNADANLTDAARRLKESPIDGLTPSQARASILDAYRRVLKGRKVEFDEADPVLAALWLTGVVRRSRGRLVPRNRITARVFNEAWIRANMPDSEAQRIRRATIKATVRTTLVLSSVVAGFAIFAVDNQRLAEDLQGALDQSRRTQREAEIAAYQAAVAQLSQAAESGEWRRVIEIVDQQKDSPHRGWEIGFWRRRLHRDVVARLGPIITGDIAMERGRPFGFLVPAGVSNLPPPQLQRGTALLVDGRRMAFATEEDAVFQRQSRTLYTVRGGKLRALDLATGARRMVAGHAGLRAASYNGEWLLLEIQSDGPPRLARYHVPSQRIVGSLPLPADYARGTSISADGQTWTWLRRPRAEESGFLEIFRWGSGTVRRVPEPISVQGEYKPYAAQSRGGRWVIVNSTKSLSFAVDLQSGTARVLGVPGSDVTTADLSSDETLAATGSVDGTVTVWDLPSGSVKWVLAGSKSDVKRVRFDSNSRGLLVIDADGDVTHTVLPPPTPWCEAISVGGDVLSCVWGLQGRRIAYITSHRPLERFKATCELGVIAVEPGNKPRVLARRSEAFSVLQAAPSGDAFYGGAMDGSIVAIDAESGALRRTYRPFASRVSSIAVSPDHRRLLVGSATGEVAIVDLSTGDMTRAPEVWKGAVLALAWSPDGRWIAASGKTDPLTPNPVRLFDSNLKLVQEWAKSSPRSYSIAFAPDSSKFAVACLDSVARIYTPGERTPRMLVGHSTRLFNAAFSPDGRQIATTSFDGTVRLFDMASGRQTASLRHRAWCNTAEFSPDGDRLATTSGDSAVSIWDPRRGTEVTRLRGHRATIWEARFSPDGRRLASCSQDGTIRIWQGDPPQAPKH